MPKSSYIRFRLLAQPILANPPSFLIGSASPACIAGHPGVMSHWQLYKRERSLAAFEQMLTLSPRERASCVFLKSEVAPTGPVRSAIERRDTRTTARVRFATQRRAILPLPKGEGGVRGKERSKHQCACDRAPFDHRQAVRSM